MFDILIWGTGTEYNRYINCIKLMEMQGQVQVVGVVSNDLYINDIVDGYRFIKKENLNVSDFDYCFIAVQNMLPVLEEAVRYGISAKKCIPIRVTAIPGFNLEDYVNLKKSNMSIFSANCWAGLCYHYLGLPFLSPTINMFESASDFNKLMMKLDYYMSLPVEYIGDEVESDSGSVFPKGIIDDVELFFMHYDTFDEAKTCWNKRKKRINNENIFVISYTDEKKELFEFEDIPFKQKVIFTSCKETSPSSIYIDKTPYGELWKPVIATATGGISLIDVIALLRQKNDFYRTK